MGSSSSSDVTSAIADGLGRPEPFWTKGVMVPIGLEGGLSTRASLYVTDHGTVSMTLGQFGCETHVWTTVEGLRTLAGHLLAAAVRAEIAGIEGPPLAPSVGLGPTEVPF